MKTTHYYLENRRLIFRERCIYSYLTGCFTIPYANPLSDQHIHLFAIALLDEE